jgi:hypothetical protein
VDDQDRGGRRGAEASLDVGGVHRLAPRGSHHRDVAARLAPHDPPSARVKTLSVFALMAGTLQLSRALADRQLADEVLDQGIQNALALLGAGQQR